MEHKQYLHGVAQRCFELSAHCYHLEIAEELRGIGTELNAKAAEINIRQPVNGNNISRNHNAAGRRRPLIAQIADFAARATASISPHKRQDPSHRNQ